MTTNDFCCRIYELINDYEKDITKGLYETKMRSRNREKLLRQLDTMCKGLKEALDIDMMAGEFVNVDWTKYHQKEKELELLR